MRRYGGDFEVFEGQTPKVMYIGEGKKGKWTARSLEQRYYELDVQRAGAKAANRQIVPLSQRRLS